MGNAKAAEQLEEMRGTHMCPPRLGCELAAHRDLGFCAACADGGKDTELMGWRLRALANRGVPNQPNRAPCGRCGSVGPRGQLCTVCNP